MICSARTHSGRTEAAKVGDGDIAPHQTELERHDELSGHGHQSSRTECVLASDRSQPLVDPHQHQSQPRPISMHRTQHRSNT